MAKILVTGGLGTVGTVLADRLRQKGHDVYVCDLMHYHDKNYIRCDVSSYMQLDNLFRKFENEPFDYVYHLGAEFGRWNGEDYYDLVWQSNAMGTKNIIRMQERYKFKMIFFSSSEVYGDYDGVMSEDVLEKYAIRQMNDYAISKWVSEMQIMNSADMFGTESVRVRLFNTYGPGEYYSPYRSVICMFTYRALHNLPYTVYTGHTRTSTYITDMVETLSNITDNFIAGEVYNIGGLDYHDIETASNLILKYAGKDDSLVTYKESEPFTTKHKKVDCSKAVRDLNHNPKVNLETGIKNTVEWMKNVYKVDSTQTILDSTLKKYL